MWFCFVWPALPPCVDHCSSALTKIHKLLYKQWWHFNTQSVKFISYYQNRWRSLNYKQCHIGNWTIKWSLLFIPINLSNLLYTHVNTCLNIHNSKSSFIFPALLFLGSGLLDSTAAYPSCQIAKAGRHPGQVGNLMYLFIWLCWICQRKIAKIT